MKKVGHALACQPAGGRPCLLSGFFDPAPHGAALMQQGHPRRSAGGLGWGYALDGLELEASRKCYVTGLNLRALYRTERRVGLRPSGEVPGQRSVRVARVEVVEGIEGLDAQFQRL